MGVAMLSLMEDASSDIWFLLCSSCFFDTPDAYTGAYYPHHGIFLVVIGLYDSHIHDL
ncbi:hypothetical protein CK203_052313 [Vitis vinifera]|uniref:Uncharacterized protein n=1 Tax=Vitis vinifera TaxID=29760 RepID=A0A438FWL2_VITVI|nr:hypothetical protein CK203_052313 [Vitis vinifera]